MKYYVRVMRPTFHRTTLALEARSEHEVVLSALGTVGGFSERDWERLEAQSEPPVIEIVFSEEEAGGDSEAGVLEYVRGVQYAYALLQADVDEAQGAHRANVAQGLAGTRRGRYHAGLERSFVRHLEREYGSILCLAYSAGAPEQCRGDQLVGCEFRFRP